MTQSPTAHSKQPVHRPVLRRNSSHPREGYVDICTAWMHGMLCNVQSHNRVAHDYGTRWMTLDIRSITHRMLDIVV